MKVKFLLSLLLVSVTLMGCESSSSNTKKDSQPAAKTSGSNPNLGTAGNPITPSRNGEFSGVDPMSGGTDGRMYNKNY